MWINVCPVFWVNLFNKRWVQILEPIKTLIFTECQSYHRHICWDVASKYILLKECQSDYKSEVDYVLA